MKVLFATSEAVPFAASGGLGDVAGSLPKALRNRQVACRVVLPLYQCVSEEVRANLKFITNITVDLGWRKQYCGIFKINHDGVIYYFIDNEYYFKRDKLYGYYDEAERFAFFSKAVLEMLNHISFTPDIIHANDWQTSLIPVYLDAYFRDSEKHKYLKTVFTIHNIQFQGKYGLDLISDVLGIPKSMEPIMKYDNCANFMKAAVECCDRVTTVSPTYAQEITDPWYSYGMDRFLMQRQYKLTGIINGIDNKLYDPMTDKDIFRNYNFKDSSGKKANKIGLKEYVGLANHDDKPLIGMVTRLTSQKGIDLVKYAADDIMRMGFKMVVLGSGDYIYEEYFKSLEARYKGDFAFINGFIPHMAKKIYSGSDIFLMPSKSEPCGLAQMVALRYGTIPIVRQTGGLADTIFDCGTGDGNGFTFKTYNAHDMLGAIERARDLYYNNRSDWNNLVSRALSDDYSWSGSAAEYKKMYKEILGN